MTEKQIQNNREFEVIEFELAMSTLLQIRKNKSFFYLLFAEKQQKNYVTYSKHFQKTTQFVI